ncbi:MAG: molybdenum cofactor guanylyltransferase [Proteobacteria bacterium]|nr:molybdenum cofactor guanylyltransferase [Pseudomonadota bacterium]
MTGPTFTGLLLAGGAGSRMGGADKGLVRLHGQPLAAHVLARLAPQVGPLLISANRHAAAYAALAPAARVLADATPGQGPLGGWLAALGACTTPWLATVPCDAPALPLDLVARLHAAALAQGADAAVATTGEGWQPTFALLRPQLAPSLAAYLASDRRAIRHWLARQRLAVVPFDDSAAFANLNTPDDLAAAG